MPKEQHYVSQPAQYHIWYRGMVIESTGYLKSLAEAKKFAKARYGAEVQVEVAYPPSFRDSVKHAVA